MFWVFLIPPQLQSDYLALCIKGRKIFKKKNGGGSKIEGGVAGEIYICKGIKPLIFITFLGKKKKNKVVQYGTLLFMIYTSNFLIV